MRTSLLATAAAVLLASVSSASAQDRVQLQWWHAMGGQLGEKVNEIAAAFNASQDKYELVPTFRGTYTDAMTGAIAAFRAGEAPNIVQVFEVGTATMMAAAGAIYPVFQLMRDFNQPFDPGAFLPQVTGYYTDSQGNMLSMPFNSSTPVLYYNRDAFAAAGLDPDNPPNTWAELADDSRKLIAAGAADCGFTTGWQSWVQIENFSALHNVPIGTEANGFGGLDTELLINGPAQVKHIQDMQNWISEDVFRYGGRRSDSAPLFYNGDCAMYMNSSAAYAGVRANTEGNFEFGVAMLPLDDEVRSERQNSIIGGATLWVMSGRSDEENQGVAEFFTFLSGASVQADWHQFSGYLPITEAAFDLTQSQGFYQRNPGTDIAIQQMTLNPPTENSKGLRFGNFVQIRDIINQELESVWAGNKTAQEALDEAVQRGDALLRDFEEING